MIETAAAISMVLLGSGVFIALLRLLKGPTPLDRLISFDLISGLAVAVMILLTVVWREVFYVDVVLVFSIVGFLSVCALVFYLDMAVTARQNFVSRKSDQGAKEFMSGTEEG